MRLIVVAGAVPLDEELVLALSFWYVCNMDFEIEFVVVIRSCMAELPTLGGGCRIVWGKRNFDKHIEILFDGLKQTIN